MNLFTLLTLGFVLLSTISTLPGESIPDQVLDWAGNPVEVGVPYDLWVVGNGTGPIGMGKFTGPSKSQRHRYVTDKPWNNITHPFPVLFYAANYDESFVRVASDYSIVFDTIVKKRPTNVWTFNLGVESHTHNFIITGGEYGSPGCENFNIWFQFIRINGTSTNPYLYKLITNPQVCKPYNCPADIVGIKRDREEHLYLNQYKFLNTPAVKISFIKHSNPAIRAVASE